MCPAGDIDPKAARAVRDFWRTRAPGVRQPTAPLRRVPNLRARRTGARFRAQRLVALTLAARQGMRPEAAHVLAVTSRLAVGPGLEQQSNTRDTTVHPGLQPTPA